MLVPSFEAFFASFATLSLSGRVSHSALQLQLTTFVFAFPSHQSPSLPSLNPKADDLQFKPPTPSSPPPDGSDLRLH